ncbi:MAG: PDZ domain-containing protein [Chloroflexi bacterium]|nr:PDZ domain-containing protein [Chloroflexota bacterium]
MIVAESTVRPALGAAVADAVRILKAKGLPGQSGAYVGRVTPGSPAAALGLHPGDIVTRLTGRPVNTADDLLQIMAQAERGMRLDMTYVRDGIAHDASVVL